MVPALAVKRRTREVQHQTLMTLTSVNSIDIAGYLLHRSGMGAKSRWLTTRLECAHDDIIQPRHYKENKLRATTYEWNG